MFDDENRTEYIVRSRIRNYEQDIEACHNHAKKHPDIGLDTERINQDKAVICELKRILTGRLKMIGFSESIYGIDI